MRVRSVAEFTAAVDRLIAKWTPPGMDWYVQPWFRGHGDASWALEPGWYRPPPSRAAGSAYYSEAQLLQTFKLRAPTYLERLPASDWEWLFLMQHYGLMTRLLDWTEGSLIALYFAVRDNAGDCDAAVWAMSPWWLNKQTTGEYDLFRADDPRVNGLAPRRQSQRLRGRLPLAITPIHANPRIVAQRGVFTIHGTERGSLDRLAKRRGRSPACLERIAIPRECVSPIRRALSISGINESLVFPELSGLCREIGADFSGR
jgi:hypothetical protein